MTHQYTLNFNHRESCCCSIVTAGGVILVGRKMLLSVVGLLLMTISLGLILLLMIVAWLFGGLVIFRAGLISMDWLGILDVRSLRFGLSLWAGSKTDGTAANSVTILTGDNHGATDGGVRSRKIDVSLDFKGSTNHGTEVTSSFLRVGLAVSGEAGGSDSGLEDTASAFAALGEITARVDGEVSSLSNTVN